MLTQMAVWMFAGMGTMGFFIRAVMYMLWSVTKGVVFFFFT